jgi:hypothetical protein
MTAATDRHGHSSSTAHRKKAHFSETHKDKKEKKYITTNAIFKAKPDRLHKRAKASLKSERSGLGKSRHRREPSSSPPPRTLADESNGMTGFTSSSQLLANLLVDALESYRGHVVDNSEHMIAHAYKDLVQQLDRTTLGPDARVSVVYKDNAGNITSEADVPIGSTFKRFEKKLQKTKDELEALWEEWEDIRREIAETGAQILDDSKFPAQFGLEAVNGHLSPSSRTNLEVESVRKLIKRESEKAHKELDQEAKDAISKHKEYQNMWRTWLQDELN